MLSRRFPGNLIFQPVVLLVLIAEGFGTEPIRMPMLLPSDLSRSTGVRLEVQPPESGIVIYDRPVDSAVLQTPMAARRLADGTVQIWYLRVDYGATTSFADQLTLCLGEIRDGQWKLPEIHASPPTWGGPNNVVMTRSLDPSTWGGFNPFQIIFEHDRLRMLYWDQPGPEGKAGGLLAESPDGKSWKKRPRAVFTEFNDAFSLMKVGDEYCLYQTALQPWPDKPIRDNLPEQRRVILLRKSTDQMQSWTPQDVQHPILAPDDKDSPATEFYCFKPFIYGAGFAGILWKYQADARIPNQHSRLFQYELVVSREGLHWERPFRDFDLKFFTYADPFLMDESIWLAAPDSPASASAGSVRLQGWKRDRMIAATGAGSFLSRPFQCQASEISLDLDASEGWIEVSLCDKEGNPVPNRAPIRIQGANQREYGLKWPAKSLPETVSLSIHIEGGAKLFGILTKPTEKHD